MISVVIPCYTITKDLEEMAIACVKSYRYQADELIVVEDGGRYSPQLMGLCDSYIYNWKNGGFTVNVNRGWRYAKEPYVAIVSSDTYLYEGDIHNLCIPGKVTSPVIVNQNIERLAGPFFVIPQSVAEERGYLMEEMHTYSSDSEYDNRVADIFETVQSVKIVHKQAQTVSVAGVEGGKQQQKDREIYEKLKQEGKAI